MSTVLSHRKAGDVTRGRAPMRFLDRGQVKYRTRLIRQLPVAQRFDHCLSMNTRFEGVLVVKSHHCSGEGYFVIYAPRNEACKQAVVARM